MDSKTQEGGFALFILGPSYHLWGNSNQCLQGFRIKEGKDTTRIDSVTVIRRGAERTGLLIRD